FCTLRSAFSSTSPIKLRIKRDRTRFEIDLLHKRARFGRAVLAVHSRIFPLDAQRALIADVVQRDDDLFEVDVAVAERAEIPEAARVGEIDVATEHADGAVAVTPPDVLHVDVEN